MFSVQQASVDGERLHLLVLSELLRLVQLELHLEDDLVLPPHHGAQAVELALQAGQQAVLEDRVAARLLLEASGQHGPLLQAQQLSNRRLQVLQALLVLVLYCACMCGETDIYIYIDIDIDIDIDR